MCLLCATYVFLFGHCDGDLQFSGGVFKESRRCFLLWSWQGIIADSVPFFFSACHAQGSERPNAAADSDAAFP